MVNVEVPKPATVWTGLSQRLISTCWKIPGLDAALILWAKEGVVRTCSAPNLNSLTAVTVGHSYFKSPLAQNRKQWKLQWGNGEGRGKKRSCHRQVFRSVLCVSEKDPYYQHEQWSWCLYLYLSFFLPSVTYCNQDLVIKKLRSKKSVSY